MKFEVDFGKDGDEYASEKDESEASKSMNKSSPRNFEATSEERSSSSSSTSSSPSDSKKPLPNPTRIMVGNLSSSIDATDLRELFEKHGRVSEVDVDVRGFALVIMPDPDEAGIAVEELNNQVVDGKEIVVEKKYRKPQPTSVIKRAIRGIVGGIELFVANVANVSEDQLKTAFKKFGDVVSVTKPRLKPEIAFIIMKNFFEARKAVDGLNRKRLDNLGHVIFVEFSSNNVTKTGRPLASLLERLETIKLYVGNVGKEATSKDLGLLFEKYGPVYDAAVLKDKGFGFIHMLSSSAAENAVRCLDQSLFKGQHLVVSYSMKHGMPTDKSRKRLAGARSVGPRIRPQSGESAFRKPVRNESLSEISDDEDAEKRPKINLRALALQRRVQGFLLEMQLERQADGASRESRIEERRRDNNLWEWRRDNNLWEWRSPRQEEDQREKQKTNSQPQTEEQNSERLRESQSEWQSSEATDLVSLAPSPKRLSVKVEVKVEAEEPSLSAEEPSLSADGAPPPPPPPPPPAHRHSAGVFSTAARITAAKSLPVKLIKKEVCLVKY